MIKNILSSCKSFYMLGIGGVSMSALAKILLYLGKKVAGSDITCGRYASQLRDMGIDVHIGHPAGQLEGFDVLVYTDAVKSDDTQIKEAIDMGITLISRGKLLSEISKMYKYVIAVAGCHGKTTCTSMLVHIFDAAGKKFTCHIGGADNVFDNCKIAGGDYFITEACEYRKNFLLLRPDTGIVLNSDADHLECYGGKNELISAYKTFMASSRRSLCLYGDACGRGTFSFGVEQSAYYSATRLKSKKGKYSFELCEGCRVLCAVGLNVCGRHNVINAVAAAGAARMYGIRAEDIKSGLESFSGVERRFENIGMYNGAELIADYAHHPAEIAATLKTAGSICTGRLFVIFQPHTYSRTKNLFDDFLRVLSSVEELLIYKTFAAREYFDAEGSALALCRQIKNARYAECERDIYHFLKDVGAGDMVLVLGAGDIYDIVKTFISQNSTGIPRTSQE